MPETASNSTPALDDESLAIASENASSKGMTVGEWLNQIIHSAGGKPKRRPGVLAAIKREQARFNIAEAKTQFSKLVERAEAGERIYIMRGNDTVAAVLTPFPKKKRCFGVLQDLLPENEARRLAELVAAKGSDEELGIAEGRDKELFGERAPASAKA